MGIRIILALLLAGLTACSSPPDSLGVLNLAKWRSDRGGCKSVRMHLVDDFKAEEKLLLGKFADEIGDLLGKPDIHQLGTRNQKFYVYFLEKGVHCEDIKKPSEAEKVVLRFNAIGLLTEITYQKEPLSQM